MLTVNVFSRFLLIDKTIRNHHKATKEVLLQKCREKFGTASQSTIEKDLQAMRHDFNAPIVYDRKAKKYIYSDENYKFISGERFEQARDLVKNILTEFQDLPETEVFSKAVDTIINTLDGKKAVRL